MPLNQITPYWVAVLTTLPANISNGLLDRLPPEIVAEIQAELKHSSATPIPLTTLPLALQKICQDFSLIKPLQILHNASVRSSVGHAIKSMFEQLANDPYASIRERFHTLVTCLCCAPKPISDKVLSILGLNTLDQLPPIPAQLVVPYLQLMRWAEGNNYQIAKAHKEAIHTFFSTAYQSGNYPTQQQISMHINEVRSSLDTMAPSKESEVARHAFVMSLPEHDDEPATNTATSFSQPSPNNERDRDLAPDTHKPDDNQASRSAKLK